MLISGGGTKNSALIDDLHENAGKNNPDLEQGSHPLVKRIPQKCCKKKEPTIVVAIFTPICNHAICNNTICNNPVATMPFATTPFATTPFATTPFVTTPIAITPFATTPIHHYSI
jgi:hypothetical protein